MNKKEVLDLMNRIKSIYNTFTIDEDKMNEWYRFLKDYNASDVIKNYEDYVTENEQPPIIFSLIRGLSKKKRDNEPEKLVKIQCDLCKKLILIGPDDWDIFEKHHRKCSKIDFIDRQTQKTLGEVIDKDKYYAMSDEELDSIYRKVMDTYMKMKSGSFIKRIPDED